MNTYLILGTDVPNSLEMRIKLRPTHLERLKALRDAGRLLMAGPTPAIDSTDPGAAGFSGSLIVAQFESLDAAKEWVAADVFVTQGVYASTEVRPFIKALP